MWGLWMINHDETVRDPLDTLIRYMPAAPFTLTIYFPERHGLLSIWTCITCRKFIWLANIFGKSKRCALDRRLHIYRTYWNLKKFISKSFIVWAYPLILFFSVHNVTNYQLLFSFYLFIMFSTVYHIPSILRETLLIPSHFF